MSRSRNEKSNSHARSAALQESDIRRGLTFLSESPPPGVDYKKVADPSIILPCQPPQSAPVDFVIRMRQPSTLGSVPLVEFAQAGFAFSRMFFPSDFECFLALDLRFKQLWNLRKTLIGDLSTTIGLAPGEEVRLDFQVSQRRLLDQSKLYSAEELRSLESTTLDKETLNVARASSVTQSWKVDGSGRLSLFDIASVGASVGYSQSATDSTQSAIQHITEATTKSSESLKTLQKIEVRSVAEDATASRTTRCLRNPFLDRAISVNAFQLLKKYAVETSLEEVRPALIIPVKRLSFDENFIEGNPDFLRQHLIDPTIANELDKVLEAAREHADKQVVTGAAQKAALRALNFLYNFPADEKDPDVGCDVVSPSDHEGTYPNVFGMPPIFTGGPPHHPPHPANPNNPHWSFQAGFIEVKDDVWLGDHSGLRCAREDANLGNIFLILSAFHAVAWQLSRLDQLAGGDGDKLRSQAIELALAIENSVSGRWEALLAGAGDSIKAVIDGADYTEVFRRLPGFLAMVDETVRPLAAQALWAPDDELSRRKREACLARLKAHLACHRTYYVESYLSYLVAAGARQPILDLVYSVIEQSYVKDQLLQLADVERCFLDRRDIVVPFRVALDDEQFLEFLRRLGLGAPQGMKAPGQVDPGTVELDVPADGLHLEVTEGLCTLASLEPPGSEPLLKLYKLMSEILTTLMRYKLPGVDMDKLIAAQKKNIDAIAEAHCVGVERVQVLARRQIEWLMESIQEASEAISTSSISGTPAELTVEQAELAKKAFEKSIAMMQEIASLLIGSQPKV